MFWKKQNNKIIDNSIIPSMEKVNSEKIKDAIIIGSVATGRGRKYTMPIEINIIKIANETEPFIEVSTKSDFQYYFRMNEQCAIRTINGNNIKGVLSYIGGDYLKIRTADIGDLAIMYSSIAEIN